MDNEQRFPKNQKKWHTIALFTCLIVGIILQGWGKTHNNSILQGLGLTAILSPVVIVVAVAVFPRKPPFPWLKELAAAIIAVSLLTGGILYTWGLSYHNIVLILLSFVIHFSLLLTLLLTPLIEKRKEARELEQRTSR